MRLVRAVLLAVLLHVAPAARAAALADDDHDDHDDHHDTAAAAALLSVAFEHARATGDFWVAEKLLAAAACRTGGRDPRLLSALGDVQMKLGRPLEALLAWRGAAALDPGLAAAAAVETPAHSRRAATAGAGVGAEAEAGVATAGAGVGEEAGAARAATPAPSSFLGRREAELEASTTPSRWQQAHALANGTAWACDTSARAGRQVVGRAAGRIATARWLRIAELRRPRHRTALLPAAAPGDGSPRSAGGAGARGAAPEGGGALADGTCATATGAPPGAPHRTSPVRSSPVRSPHGAPGDSAGEPRGYAETLALFATPVVGHPPQQHLW